MAEQRLELSLARSDRAPAGARRAVQQLVSENPAAEPHLPMLMLLTSEVVTNAIIHPRLEPSSAVQLEVVISGGHTRVAVSDEGEGFDTNDPRPRGPEAGGGYGLRLLEAGSSRWGTSAAGGRFSVWFEIDHAEPLPKSA